MFKAWRPWVAATLLLIALGPATASAMQSREAEKLFERAQKQIQDDRYSKAEELLGDLIESYDDDDIIPDAMYWRAFALYRLHEYEDSRDLLNDAIDQYPDSPVLGDAETLLTRVEGRLARRGDRNASRDITRRADEDEDEDSRMAALNALIHMDADRALPILKRILSNKDKYTPEMREKAIFLIAQHGDDDESAELLMKLAQEDEDSEVREQAIFWLSQTGSERALPLLLKILAESDEPALQEKALFSISQIGGEEAAAALRDAAINADNGVEVRANAIFWLGQSNGNAEFLESIYNDLDSRELKEKVIFSISQSGGKKSKEFLTRILFDEGADTELRTVSLFWLGQSDAIDISELMEIYNDMDDQEMREQAVFVISQHGGPDATEALIQIVRTEKNQELRENALFWLGQSDDESAMDLLEEIIESGGR